MKKYLLIYLSVSLAFVMLQSREVLGQTYHSLNGGSFSMDWTSTTMITVNDNWSGVASIIGYLGDGDAGSPTGIDPQTVIIPLTTVDVIANQTNPNTQATGGVAEFEITDPVVALQGSGTADFPNIIIYLNATGRGNIRVQYDLRDIDGAADNAIQQVALQYRIGNAGNFTNIPAGYVADASTGPSLATLVTHVDVTLPGDCNGRAEVQLRIITTNAPGSDEWIGIDNIVISSIADIDPPAPTFVPLGGGIDVPVTVNPTITFDEPVRKTDGNPIENADLVGLAGLVTFKKTDGSGADVQFTATIDATKKVITVTPSSSLDNSQVYYLAIGAVEDASGNESTAKNITFTTIAAATPTLTLTAPLGGETYYAGGPATISWNYANVTTIKIEAYVLNSDRNPEWVPLPFGPTVPAAPGSVNFNVPADALYWTHYKIKISDASNPAVYSESGEFTVICVPTSLTMLRQRCIAGDVVKIASEVTVTFLRTNRYQKYVQDSGKGLLIDDAANVLKTSLAIGDNITGLEGTLGLYNGVLQLVPTKASVTVVSVGNTVTPQEMSLTNYQTNYLNYESMIIKLSDVTFNDGNGTNAFAAATNYLITDGTNTITYRTFNADETDLVGYTIPNSHVKVNCIAGFYNSTIQVYGMKKSDFDFISSVEKTPVFSTVLYPVPARDFLKVRSAADISQIEILDATGRIVTTINGNGDVEIRIPVNRLRSGIYFIRFTTSEGKLIRKFIKS